MNSEIQRLQAAFVRKEQNQNYLSDLERLKIEGSVSPEQYTEQKAGYQQNMTVAVSEIASIKSRLRQQLQAAEQNLSTLRAKLEEIGTKHKAGELASGKYQDSHQQLTRDIEHTEANIAEWQKLVGARSSADIDTTLSKAPMSPPVKVEEVKVKEVSRMLPGRAKLSYVGKGEDILGRVILWGILTVVTLGIYQAWAINHLYRYIVEHIKVDMASQNRVNLQYTERGEDIFGRMILWGILTVVTLGIYSPWAITNLCRYIIEHTTVEVY